jgi:putative glycosyltransferase (TIGR04348 family)
VYREPRIVKIILITPAQPRSRSGNRNTALRWAALLRSGGHRVSVQVEWNGEACDLMLALHARKSYPSTSRFVSAHRDAPVVLALTGTDLYRDIRSDAHAQEAMRYARKMIVLQQAGLEDLDPELREKTHVVYQSAQPLARAAPLKTCYEVVIIGHLREEKDPFRGAAALKHLPAQSRIRLRHMGRALSPEMAAEARRWSHEAPQYRWLGELPHWQVRQRLARSRLMLISSRMEGGANVVSESLASDVPVIASRVPGNIGMLGQDYAGYYPVEDERALAASLWRAESDPEFYRLLEQQCRARKPLVAVECEREALLRVIEEARS